MLSTMREKTRIIMLVLAVAFIGWLIFDVGMGGTGQGQMTPQDVGSVNGRPITFQAWQDAYKAIYEEFRAQNPGVSLTREDQRMLEDQAFTRLVSDHLLREEYRRRGISVSDAEIVDAVLRYPPPQVQQAPDFQTDGRFDLAKYQRFLRSNNEQSRQWVDLMEARWREELPRYKLFQEVTSDIFVSDSKLWQIWRDAHDSVRLRVLLIRPGAAVANASIRITDEEIARYYREHRDDFHRPARAVLSYVGIPKLVTRSDSAAVVAYARALRDSLVRGASFEDLAREVSGDTASRANGGSLGTFARGAMVAPFDRAAFSQPLGTVSEPVLTEFGAHLIKVESRTGDSATARHILIRWGKLGAALDSLDARADSLNRYAAEQRNGAMLDSVAAWMQLGINRGPPLLRGVPYVLGRYRIPDVGLWAFESQVGETSPVIETEGAFYVFRLDSLWEEGVPRLEEITDDVRRAVLAEKQRAAALEIARDAERRLAGGQSFEAVADALRLTVLPLGPFTRTQQVPVLGQATTAVGAAFRLDVGERSGIMESDDGYFLMLADRRVRADSAAWLAQRDAQRAQVIQQARQLRVQLFLDGLRRAATIRDRRDEILRPVDDDTTDVVP
jgi:peptidyl-prolyl cis-trans isomerase D